MGAASEVGWVEATATAGRGGLVAAAACAPTADRARILVIDDEPDVGRALRRVLGRRHDVTLVDGGLAGLELILAQRFDLVLCDLMMPGLGGAELHRRVAQALPGAERRIVFMSGGAYGVAERSFLDGLSNRHLEKPFSIVELQALVAEHAPTPATWPVTEGRAAQAVL